MSNAFSHPSLLFVALLAGAGPISAQTQTDPDVPAPTTLAQTPPMGWNSWDSYGLTITEDQFRANMRVLSDKLKPFGWTYAVIDEGWFLKNPQDRPRPELLQYEIDGYGRYIPVPARFPSALSGAETNTGFAEIGREVHALGLRFGIHIVRGVPRVSVHQNTPIEGSTFRATEAADQTDACPWDPTNWGVKDNAAGQAWYDALIRQYAGWGVDLLKVDCIADHPYRLSEIRQIRRAIDRSGRPMVLSLSPGPTSLSHAAEVGSLAQMWRISNDIWDVWDSPAPFPRTVKSQFEPASAWAPSAHPGNWPDADMLPVGELRPKPDVGPGPRKTRLSMDEQQTMLTLWAMARSPLILGANLTLLDDTTLHLLSNQGLLRIDQTATASRQVLREGALVVWTADLPDGKHAVAAFNLGDNPLLVTKDFPTLGLDPGKWQTRDLWQTRPELPLNAVTRTLAPHGCVLLELRR